MKTLFAFLAVAALAATPRAAEPQAKAGACAMKKVEKGYFCPGCKKDIIAENVRDGACKKCDEKAVPIEFCVAHSEPYFKAQCQHAKKGDKPFTCCGKESVKDQDEDRAKIVFECACGGKADAEAGLKHKEGCKPGGVKKVCSKSGTAPHVAAK